MGDSVPKLVSTLCHQIIQSKLQRDELADSTYKKIHKNSLKKAFTILLKKSSYVPENAIPLSKVTTNVKTLVLFECLQLKIKNETKRANLLLGCISKVDVEKYENVIHLLLNLKEQRLGNFACQNLTSLEKILNNFDHFIFLEPIRSLDLKNSNRFAKKRNNYLPWFNLEDFDAPPEIRYSSVDFSKALTYNNSNENQINLAEEDTEPKEKNLYELTEMYYKNSEKRPKTSKAECARRNEFLYDTYRSYMKAIAQFSANSSSSSNDIDITPVNFFNRHVTDMLFGFPSSTFKWNERTKYFEKKKNVCFHGVLPDSINGYCESLIVCGSLHKRLLKLISRPTHRHGLFYQVFCVKLIDILKWYHIPLSTELSAKSLLRIKYNLPHIEETIETIARCFCVTDEFKTQEVPRGIDFLIYLEKIYWSTLHLSIAQKISRYILYLAYDAYIKIYVIPWILEGTLLSNKEFFIERTSRVYSKSRKFWTQEFRLVPDKNLPEMFKNEAEMILTCGKNIHLMNNISFLTRYIPKYESPFKLGVTLKELLELKDTYLQIYDAHYQMYSPIVTYKTLKEYKAYQAKELEVQAIKIQEDTMRRLKLELEEKVRKTILEKEKQAKVRFEELQKNVEDKAMAIYNEQLQSLNELRKIDEIKNARQREIEEEKEKLIAYYTELTDMADKKLQLANIRTEELTEILTQLQKSNLSPNELQTLCTKLSPNYKRDKINLTINHTLDETNQNLSSRKTNLILENLILNQNDTITTGNICDNTTTPTNNNLLITSQIESQSSIDLLKQYNENAAAARRNKAKVLTQEMNIDCSRTYETSKKVTERTNKSEEIVKTTSNLIDNKYANEKIDTTEKNDQNSKCQCSKGFLIQTKNRVYKCHKNQTAILVKRSLLQTFVRKYNSEIRKLKIEKYKLKKSINNNPYLSHLKDTLFKKPIKLNKSKRPYVKTWIKQPRHYELEVPVIISSCLHPSEPTLTFEEAMEIKWRYERQFMNSKPRENGKCIKIYGVDVENLLRNDSNRDYLLYLQYSFQFPLLVQYHLLNLLTLKYFLLNENLVDHFNSLREFYFLASSHFQTEITKELCKVLHEIDYPQELFNHKTLSEIMNNVLLESNIKNQDRISFKIAHVPSVVNLESTEVLDGIELVYLTEWPLNIFITESIISKYNKVFNYLLKIKRTQFVLNEIFYELKVLVKEPGFEELVVMDSPDYKSMQFIRHVLNTWLTSLQRHIMGTVLHIEWLDFENILLECRSLNDIHNAHKKYLNNLIFKCSLNENAQEFIAAIYRSFECVYTIYNLLRCRQWYLKENDQFYTHPNMKKIKICFQNFKQLITYIIKMSKKQIARDYQPHLEYLLLMFDFNFIFEKELL